MSTFQEVSRAFQAPATSGGVFKALATELSVLLQAIMYPGKLIAEVEAFAALNKQADRIEASDPDRAAALRRQAARIGR